METQEPGAATPTDTASLKALAISLLSEAELEVQLGEWDANPESLLAFYARLAERVQRSYPDLPFSEALQSYQRAVWERDYPYAGTTEGSSRHLWAIILDVPVHEVTGGDPVPPALPHPSYRVLPDDEDPSEEAYSRAMELLMKLPRRRLRPIDPDPNGPGEPWTWPDRSDPVSLAVRGAVRDVAEAEMDGPTWEWFQHRYRTLLEPSAPF